MDSTPRAWPLGWVCRLALLLVVLALVGCDSNERATLSVNAQGVFKSAVGRVPDYPQRQGDPASGYDALVNRAVANCGIPYRAYVKASGATNRNPGPQFRGRSGRNLALPYPLTIHRTATGVDLVTSNCLLCHAAPFEGNLIMGLGNAFLDLTQDPLAGVASAGAALTDRAERGQWRRWVDRIAVLSSHMMIDTVGVNSADNLTLALMAHRNPKTLAWSDQPLLDPPPTQPLPVAVPPWWNMRKKHALFHNGEGRGDQVRLMMLASADCIDSVPEAQALDAWLVDVRAYLATLQPPKYPYVIDQSLAGPGDALFQSHCKRCHGTYGADWRYPNRVVALGTVGTDPALARAAYADYDRFRIWFQQSYYGESSQAAPALGYIAPPLDGVWATAPYLHNDSVPTLAAVLNSPARPTYWRF
ncbi:MAG TPA: hypothetical protein VES73_14820, partial [Lamprocystis sp. (in: g-proteobacteria)]|nr:hypothetical protein [Lamprocystis sp. (in: g-proteobacteria)]